MTEPSSPFQLLRTETVSLVSDSPKLKSHPWNQEIYGDESIDWLIDQLKTDEIINPIKVNEDYMVLSGHLRLKACLHLIQQAEQEADPEQIIKFSTVTVEVYRLESEEAQNHFFLSNNAYRCKTIDQKLRELLYWKQLLDGPKFDHLSKVEKRERLKKEAQVGSESSFGRLKNILDHMEELEDQDDDGQSLDDFLNKAKSSGNTFNSVFKLVQKAKKIPIEDLSAEVVMAMTEAKLDSLCEEMGYILSLRMFRIKGDPTQDPMNLYRLAVIERLIDDGSIADEEAPEVTLEIPPYSECLGLTKGDLMSLAFQYGWTEEVKNLESIESVFFLARKIAELNKEEIGPVTAEDLGELSWVDLKKFAVANQITENIDKNIKKQADPLGYTQRQVARHFGIEEEMKAYQNREFDFERYFEKGRDLNFGKCRMSVDSNEKTKGLVITIDAAKDMKRAKKLAELLTKVSSENIDELLALVNVKRAK